MKELRTLVLIIALGLIMGACSSSTTDEGLEEEWDDEFGENAEEGAETAEADTDGVPQETAENTTQSEPETENSGDLAQAPTEMPLDTSSSEPAPMSSGGLTTYTTQKGDTLMKIAFETYGDLNMWRKIFEANRDKIQDPNALTSGVTLNLESPVNSVSISRNGEKYLIKNGDTLGTISKNVYGTPGRWKDIWKNNPELIRDPNKIYAGFWVYYVPDSGTTSPAPLAEEPVPTDSRAPSSN